MKPLDRVHLAGIEVSCIVGIHSFERVTPQPLVCELEVGFERRPGRFGASLEGSIDYARLEGLVRFVLEHGHFWLLEDAVEALCATVLAPRTGRPAYCGVRLTKPQALGGRCVPAVSIERWAADFSPELEHNHFGTVDILHEGPACGVYVLHIPPGGSIPAHVHTTLFEAELVLDPGLLLNRRAVAAGEAHVWPAQVVHGYTNPTHTDATILCINRPRFDPKDELLVVPEPDELPDVTAHRMRYFGAP